jgi:two-component system sensor histidine kinase KdpD
MNSNRKNQIKNILIVIGILVVSTLVAQVFSLLKFQEATIIIIYMLAVVFISQITTNYIYGFYASVISVLAFNFFFTHPLYTFNISQPDYLFTFFVMFLASFLSSSLTSKLKNEKKLSQLKTNQVLLVEAINHSFQVNDLHNALMSSMNLIAENCDAYCELFVRINQTNFDDHTNTNKTQNLINKYEKPIMVNKEEVGKLVLLAQSDIPENWISTIGDILSQNIERHDLVEKQSLAQLQIREQKIRNDLLSAISHDLRTPLATIVGSSDTLLENLDKLNQSEQKELLLNIKNDSVWLINSVENILSFMRVEEGINLKLQIDSVEELFGDILSRMVNRVPQKLVLDLPKEPIYAKMDIQLMGKVLLNLVDNASKYSPLDSKITLKACVIKNRLIYEVIDEGDGIEDSQKKKVFDRYITSASSSSKQRKGLGLGLAICKSIVEAHGGRIIVKDNQPKGSIFHCEFPYEGVTNE